MTWRPIISGPECSRKVLPADKKLEKSSADIRKGYWYCSEEGRWLERNHYMSEEGKTIFSPVEEAA